MKDPRDHNEVIVDTISHLAERGDLIEFQVTKKKDNQKPLMELVVLSESRQIPPVVISDYFADTLAEENRGNVARGRAGFGSWDEVAEAVYKYLKSYAHAAGRRTRAVGLH